MDVAKAGERSGGLAIVQIHPSQPKVRVTVKGEEGAKDKVYTLDKEECPSYVQNGTFFVSLNADGSKMYGMRPRMGLFKAKVKEFVAAKDKEPMPKTKTAPDGSYTYMTFSVLVEITEGECKGMVIPVNLPYNFQEAQKDIPGRGMQSVTQISHPKSKRTPKLIEFLDATGIIKKDIPWKENLLPLMQRMILKEDRQFQIIVKDGWVDSITGDL